jgi:hypothetical protein
VLIGDVAGDQETRGLQGWVYKVGFTRLGLQGWVYKVGFTKLGLQGRKKFYSDDFCKNFILQKQPNQQPNQQPLRWPVKYTTINLGRASKSLLFL